MNYKLHYTNISTIVSVQICFY